MKTQNWLYEKAVREVDEELKITNGYVAKLAVASLLLYGVTMGAVNIQTQNLIDNTPFPRTPSSLSEISKKKFEQIRLEKEIVKFESLYSNFKIKSINGKFTPDAQNYLESRIKYFDNKAQDLRLGLEIAEIKKKGSLEIDLYNMQFKDTLERRAQIGNVRNYLSWKLLPIIMLPIFLAGLASKLVKREVRVKKLKKQYDV